MSLLSWVNDLPKPVYEDFTFLTMSIVITKTNLLYSMLLATVIHTSKGNNMKNNNANQSVVSMNKANKDFLNSKDKIQCNNKKDNLYSSIDNSINKDMYQ